MTTPLTQDILTEARKAVVDHQIGDRFPRVFNAVIELADQRDELLTAIKHLKASPNPLKEGESDDEQIARIDAAWAALNAVIAKVERQS